MKLDNSTIKAARDAVALDAQTARIAALSGLKPSVVKWEISGLTKFEIIVITRAFVIGEFDPSRLDANLEQFAVHFIENGRQIYDLQMRTAEIVFNRLKEKVNFRKEF